MERAVLDLSANLTSSVCKPALFIARRRRSCSSQSPAAIKASYSVSRTSSSSAPSGRFTRKGFDYWGIGREISRLQLLLDASEDEYGGVVVDPDKLQRDPAAFGRALRASMSFWRSAGKKGIWLKLTADRPQLVPVAVKEGFQYHHAEKSYLMLTYWIPEGPSMLPANASHQVGVGGFVINDQMEVLVVQEKFCSSPASPGSWKLPTGFILENEEIFTGAVREVKEETGVDTEFLEVVAFRHVHRVAFEKSDLFFICALRPLSREIKIDETEIRAAKWMALDEFTAQPLIRDDGMFKKVMDICIQRLGKRCCGLTPHPVVSKFDGRSSSLYYGAADHCPDANCDAA